MALVFLVIFFFASATLMFPLVESTSANTGFEHKYSAALPVAAKVSAGASTSSPFLTPAAKYAACRAAVPELTATAYLVPAALASAFSNCSTAGHWVSQPERRVVTTACMSASRMSWVEYGIMPLSYLKSSEASFLFKRNFLLLLVYRKSLGTLGYRKSHSAHSRSSGAMANIRGSSFACS